MSDVSPRELLDLAYPRQPGRKSASHGPSKSPLPLKAWATRDVPPWPGQAGKGCGRTAVMRPTVKQAQAALFDYRVPPNVALKLYRRARGSRFGDATTAWQTDGGR